MIADAGCSATSVGAGAGGAIGVTGGTAAGACASVPNAGRGGSAGVDATRVAGTAGLNNGGLAAPDPPAGPTNGRAPRRANGDFVSSVF